MLFGHVPSTFWGNLGFFGVSRLDLGGFVLSSGLNSGILGKMGCLEGRLAGLTQNLGKNVTFGVKLGCPKWILG